MVEALQRVLWEILHLQQTDGLWASAAVHQGDALRGGQRRSGTEMTPKKWMPPLFYLECGEAEPNLKLAQPRAHPLWDALLPNLLKLPQVELDSVVQQQQRRGSAYFILIQSVKHLICWEAETHFNQLTRKLIVSLLRKSWSLSLDSSSMMFLTIFCVAFPIAVQTVLDHFSVGKED